VDKHIVHNFAEIFGIRKPVPGLLCNVVCVTLRSAVVSAELPTDRYRPHQSIYRAVTASRNKRPALYNK